MLRYFAHSVRDFTVRPDNSDHRLNWEFWVTFKGSVKPLFLDSPDQSVPDANYWILAPGTRYQWKAKTPQVERLVVHYAYVPVELEQFVKSRGYFSRTLDDDELREARDIAGYLDAAIKRSDALATVCFQRAACDLTFLALRNEVLALTHSSTLESSNAERAERALAWYMEHLYEGPKIERIAAEMNISVSHLRRLFHSQFGRSPKAVFDRIRLERAASLLASTTATLEDIAVQSGFRNMSDFCRIFKKHYGHSPHVWRRSVGVVSSQAKKDIFGTSQRKITVDWPMQLAPVSRKGALSVWPKDCKVPKVKVAVESRAS